MVRGVVRGVVRGAWWIRGVVRDAWLVLSSTLPLCHTVHPLLHLVRFRVLFRWIFFGLGILGFSGFSGYSGYSGYSGFFCNNERFYHDCKDATMFAKINVPPLRLAVFGLMDGHFSGAPR